MRDALADSCDACSNPIAEADPVRLHEGRRFHLGCWWRRQRPVGADPVDAAAERMRALRREVHEAIRDAARAERAEPRAPTGLPDDADDPCAVCGEAIRAGAPDHRTADWSYHAGCWERPAPLASWLLIGAAPGTAPADRGPARVPWANPRTATGDPICLLCGEGIEVARPVVHLQGWVAHRACWEPPAPAGPRER